MAELALTVREAAELLGVSTRTVYEMCYHRQIPFRRVKGQGKKDQGMILISRAGLEQWILESEPERKPALKLAKGR